MAASDSCCSKRPAQVGASVRERSQDLEKATCRNVSHVSVYISGMTCTGCAKKATNILGRFPGVLRPRINFITSSAEFDLDVSLDANAIIARFEYETGFECSQIKQEMQRLDVIMSKCDAEELDRTLPHGIDSVYKIDKDTCSVIFDPAIIGARAVLRLVPSGELAVARGEMSSSSDRKRMRRMAWSLGLAAMFTIPVVVFNWSKNSVPYAKRSVISFVLATLVQLIAVPEFYVAALKSLVFSRVVEMDMLIVISTTAAYGYSTIAFALTHSGHVLEQKEFFETSTLLITLVLVGRLLSVAAKLKAVNAVSMKSLQAETALLVNRYGKTSKVDARLLQYRDKILIPPFARVVTDGDVIHGSSSIDESMVTGETSPIVKVCGDSVIAGTINQASPLTVRVTRLPGKNSITDIAMLVENALHTKPRAQEMADMFAGWFIPTIMAVSTIVFTIWLIIGLKIRDMDGGSAVGLAITYSIAVLAISCPCALGLAIPMVLIIAGGVAAKSGVIIKNAIVTENAHKTTDVVFDKTGTLTSGALEVVEEYYDSAYRAPKYKILVFSILKDNDHPVSIAVSDALAKESKSVPLEKVQSIQGAGLLATFNGKTLKAGNPWWLCVDQHPQISRLIEANLTALAVTVDDKLIAAYGLKSSLRSDAKTIIEDLQNANIACHIVSGDGPSVVQDTAATLGIDQANVVSRQTPSDKQKYVKDLIDKGRVVMFCGDGTNDAVAIAQAHIGVQIGSASDTTRATANVILNGGLDGILVLLSVSKQSFRRIWFNLIWAGVYNLFAILLAAGSFVKFRIPPAYAGLGEIVSILPIILVALTLMRGKHKFRERERY